MSPPCTLISMTRNSRDRWTNERTLAAVRGQLGDEAYAAVWAEGVALPLEQAVAEALFGAGPARDARGAHHRGLVAPHDSREAVFAG